MPLPWKIALAAVLISATALRVWGIDYGLPLTRARPDESIIIEKVLGFESGDFNPRWFIYPTFFLYLLYGYLKALVWVGGAVGILPDATTLDTLNTQDLRTLYVLARSMSAVLSVGAVAMTFALGRAVWDYRVGVFAALMLVVSPLQVREAHFFKVDGALTFFSVVALLAAVRLDQRVTVRRAIVAGATSGLVLATKYSVAMVAPGVAAAFLGARREPSLAGRLAMATLVGVTAVATFLVTAPFVVIEFPRFAGHMQWTTQVWLRYAGSGLGSGFGYHVTQSLLVPHGLPVTGFLLAAFLWHIPNRRMLIVNVFLLVTMTQLGVAAPFTRYFPVLLPALCVVGGTALVRLGSLIGPAPLRAAATAVVLVVLLAQPVWHSIRLDQILASRDTRLEARDWLEANVPAGTTILPLGSHWPWIFGEPELEGYTVRRRPLIEELGIRYVVTHEHPLAYSRLPESFDRLRPGLQLEKTFSPFVGPGMPSEPVFEPGDAFYVPTAGFSTVRRGGPIVRIYSVKGMPTQKTQ